MSFPKGICVLFESPKLHPEENHAFHPFLSPSSVVGHSVFIAEPVHHARRDRKKLARLCPEVLKN